MTPLELRQKINQQLNSLLPEQLALVSNFLDILQAIALLQFAGTWQGDDLD